MIRKDVLIGIVLVCMVLIAGAVYPYYHYCNVYNEGKDAFNEGTNAYNEGGVYLGTGDHQTAALRFAKAYSQFTLAHKCFGKARNLANSVEAVDESYNAMSCSYYMKLAADSFRSAAIYYDQDQIAAGNREYENGTMQFNRAQEYYVLM